MNAALERSLSHLRMMWRIRALEETVDRLYGEGVLKGTFHLCIGQEACAVGAVSALEPGDCVVSHHRGHGHLLAKGADPARVLAELLGRTSGYCRGKGGTQHLSAMDIGFLGTNGITGGGIPLATGAALAFRYRREPRVAAAFFGEGAAAQGTFHESLNMASLWRLPVVYVCENNRYAMSMPLERAAAVPSVAARARAYARGRRGLRAVRVDGMDVRAVERAMRRLAARARRGDGPGLLEAVTYRFLGHSKSDARVYRTREEESEWRKRDPIARLAARLRRLGAPGEAVAAAETEARAEIDRAAAAALAAPEGGRDEALAGVWA